MKVPIAMARKPDLPRICVLTAPLAHRPVRRALNPYRPPRPRHVQEPMTAASVSRTVPSSPSSLRKLLAAAHTRQLTRSRRELAAASLRPTSRSPPTPTRCAREGLAADEAHPGRAARIDEWRPDRWDVRFKASRREITDRDARDLRWWPATSIPRPTDSADRTHRARH